MDRFGIPEVKRQPVNIALLAVRIKMSGPTWQCVHGCDNLRSMNIRDSLSRRGFLAMAAASAAAMPAQTRRRVPVGVLVYAVIDDWSKDLKGTTTALAQMGFEGLELTRYANWTPAQAKEYRALMDSLKLKCFATHTEPPLFVPGDNIKKMIELNHTLGTQTISCVRGLAASVTPAANNPETAGRGRGMAKKSASTDATQKAPPKKGSGTEIGYHPVKARNEADAWKELTDILQNAAVMLKREGFVLSFHNHGVEFETRKNGVGRRRKAAHPQRGPDRLGGLQRGDLQLPGSTP